MKCFTAIAAVTATAVRDVGIKGNAKMLARMTRNDAGYAYHIIPVAGKGKSMKAKISIVPHKAGDGGIMCYPAKENIRVPKDSSWKLVKCPICGKGCWETPIARQAKQAEPQLKYACTMCALKLATKGV